MRSACSFIHCGAFVWAALFLYGSCVLCVVLPWAVVDLDKIAIEWCSMWTAKTSCRYSLHIYAATLPCGNEATHLAQRGSKPLMAQLRRASLRSAGRHRATPAPSAPAKRGRSCPTKRQKNAKVVEIPFVAVHLYRFSNRHLQVRANTGCPLGRNLHQPTLLVLAG